MTVVYDYGMRAPTNGAKQCADQAHLSHKYFNALMETKIKGRADMEALYMKLPAYAEASKRKADLEAQLLVARDAIKAVSAAARKKVDSKDLKKKATAIRKLSSEAGREVNAARKVAKDLFAKELAAIYVSENVAKKAARKHYSDELGLYWGTYLKTEQAFEAACKPPKPKPGKVRKPFKLKFRRWDGSAHLAVQIQKTSPLSTAELFGDDTRIRIESLHPDAYVHPSRGERRRLQRTHVHVRVASDDKGKPIWAVFPVILHRELPPGQVKWVTILRYRVEAREVWKIQFSIQSDAKTIEKCGEGVVGIDIGWRAMDNGLRAACVVGADDVPKYISLQENVPRAIEHTEKLRSIRDKNLTRTLKWAAPWLKEHAAALPEWLTEATTHLHQWRSQARLANLVVRWRGERFAGDEEAFGVLEAWRKQDKHLWTWEVHERQRAERRRREQYRLEAVHIARTFGTIVLEDFKLDEVIEEKPPEDQSEEDSDNPHAKYNRVVVAVSALRECIVNAVTRRGGLIIWAPAADTTRQCHTCKKICKWDQAAKLRHTCEHCGAEWDQDWNAGRNLRDYATEEVIGGEQLALAEKAAKPKVSRFAKKKPAAESSSPVASDYEVDSEGDAMNASSDNDDE